MPWLLLLLLWQTGCVHRRLTIRSNPPGAVVYIDDYPVGTTPCSVSYTYYGTRKVRLVRDGYETLTVMQRIPAPWYEWFPLDFISENVVPIEIRDQRTLDYNLVQQRMVPTEETLRNAEQLRSQVNGARIPGAPVSGPVSTPVVPGPAVPVPPNQIPLPPPPVPGGNTAPPENVPPPRIRISGR